MTEATTEQVTAAWVEALPDRYLDCRDHGHNWKPLTARWVEDGGRTIERLLRCSRCRTERLQALSPTGHTLANRYTYPDGYTAPPGSGRFDTQARDGMRLESVLRFMR